MYARCKFFGTHPAPKNDGKIVFDSDLYYPPLHGIVGIRYQRIAGEDELDQVSQAVEVWIGEISRYRGISQLHGVEIFGLPRSEGEPVVRARHAPQISAGAPTAGEARISGRFGIQKDEGVTVSVRTGRPAHRFVIVEGEVSDRLPILVK